MEEFLRCELYYHCRALEMLGPALVHIRGVDAESAREVRIFAKEPQWPAQTAGRRDQQ